MMNINSAVNRPAAKAAVIICNVCHIREAKLHLTDIDKESGDVQSIDICVECSIRTGLLPASGPVSLSNLLTQSIPAILEADSDSPEPSGPTISEPVINEPDQPAYPPCPSCGTTWDEVQSNVRFGCDHDYDHFRDQVDDLLGKLHGSKTHVGKVPVNLQQMRTRRGELRRLNTELEDAIVLENYEEAARLRDSIRDLETQ